MSSTNYDFNLINDERLNLPGKRNFNIIKYRKRFFFNVFTAYQVFFNQIWKLKLHQVMSYFNVLIDNCIAFLLCFSREFTWNLLHVDFMWKYIWILRENNFMSLSRETFTKNHVNFTLTALCACSRALILDV